MLSHMAYLLMEEYFEFKPAAGDKVSENNNIDKTDIDTEQDIRFNPHYTCGCN
jgi:hypothetical protein